MSFSPDDRLQVLDYLKQSIGRMREAAAEYEGQFAEALLDIADQIAGDVERLEIELIAAGYLPRPA
jgi:hypothetical protein